MKKPLRKRLINWIILCGIFGALSLVFDQFAIQQESEIRRVEKLSSDSRINAIIVLDYNQHLLDLFDQVIDFTTDAMTRAVNIERSELVEKYQKENQIVVEEVFGSVPLLLKDIEYFSQTYVSILEENHQRLFELGLMTDKTKQVVEKIVNQDFIITKQNISVGEFIDGLNRLNNSAYDLNEIIEETVKQELTYQNEFLNYTAQASLKSSYKQRFLLLGTISQIISLMFLIVFFKALYTIQEESKVETEPKS